MLSSSKKPDRSQKKLLRDISRIGISFQRRVIRDVVTSLFGPVANCVLTLVVRPGAWKRGQETGLILPDQSLQETITFTTKVDWSKVTSCNLEQHENNRSRCERNFAKQVPNEISATALFVSLEPIQALIILYGSLTRKIQNRCSFFSFQASVTASPSARTSCCWM